MNLLSNWAWRRVIRSRTTLIVPAWWWAVKPNNLAATGVKVRSTRALSHNLLTIHLANTHHQYTENFKTGRSLQAEYMHTVLGQIEEWSRITKKWSLKLCSSGTASGTQPERGITMPWHPLGLMRLKFQKSPCNIGDHYHFNFDNYKAATMNVLQILQYNGWPIYNNF